MMTKLPPNKHCDVAIIGSGPAGLAVAIELKKLGVKDVLVLERSSQAGGNPRHCGHSPFGLREFKRIYLGPNYAQKMVDTALNLGVSIVLNATVVALHKNAELCLSTPYGPTKLTAKRVVLCSGIRETPRSKRLVSGQRPLGIMTTGALQSMVYLNQMAPFNKPVIIGSELVAFSALASCRHAKIKPVAMIEANNKLSCWQFARLYPMLLGVKFMTNTSIVEIIGKHQVTGIKLRHDAGHETIIDCDGVIFTGQFTPESSLAKMSHLVIDSQTGGPAVDQFYRCSDTSYFATGNVLRPVETASWCWQEGMRTARCVVQSLQGAFEDTNSLNKTSITTIQNSNALIKYILPQRLTLTNKKNHQYGMQKLQLRLNTPCKGIVSLHNKEHILVSKSIDTVPERRILLPLDSIYNEDDIGHLAIQFSAKT